MPSLKSKLLKSQMRLLRPVITGFSIKTSRAFQDKLAAFGTRALADKITLDSFEIGTIPAVTATPCALQEGDEDIVFYLHGGGYVTGGMEYARGVAGALAAETNKRVVAIAYRLAPEHPYPAALEDSFAAYKYLLETTAAENISMIGESAGGGLILALCHLLKREGLPLPARLVPISPWVDLTMSAKSYIENQKIDPCVTYEEVRGFVSAYSPEDQLDPLVSPIFGDFAGFPPCRIYAGTDELLRDEAIILADKLTEAEVENTLIVKEGMWHAYVLYPTPESNEAVAEIKEFLSEQKKGTSHAE